MQAYQDFPDSRQRNLDVLGLASLLARLELRRVGGMLKKDYGKGMQSFRVQHAVRLRGREIHLVTTIAPSARYSAGLTSLSALKQ